MQRGRAFMRLYPSVLRAYAVAFALMHVINFEASGWQGLLIPLFLLPQLFAGLLLSYIRLRQGLLHSMLLHALFNMVFCLFAFIEKFAA